MASSKKGTFQSVEVDDEVVNKWAPQLVKLSWAVIAIGVVVGYAVWLLVDGTTGEDVGALIWVLSFSGSVALMSIRQTLLAESV
ncbi:hypothetical protein [Ornithinimicrobium cryptoxanthini]|uniref:Uncharacterized protein n=1 Tax=Ornithinimicrobium cryptoxanthini TaxID=2934161 RepID=A0ABY4YDJ6_9MICO|nr:hypothetical protein [Ornithinimicrobium cryptoxanthini]USQ74845.1 hypothetical protein NF557_09185 [Ornithinimicrobium cryptoxanthini]